MGREGWRCLLLSIFSQHIRYVCIQLAMPMHDAWLSANSINLLQHNLRISFSISAGGKFDCRRLWHWNCYRGLGMELGLGLGMGLALGFAVKLKLLESCAIYLAISSSQRQPPLRLRLTWTRSCPVFLSLANIVYFI